MKKRDLLILIALTLLACKKETQEEVSKIDLPLNNSFESKDSSWIIWGGEVTSEEAHSGERSLYFNNSESKWAYGEQYIKVPNGADSVKLSGWLKTKDVVQGAEAWETALLNFEYVDTLYNHIDPYPQAASELLGTNDWKEYTKTSPIVDGAFAIKLHCALGNATGEMWIDDICVEFIGTDGEIVKSKSIPQDHVFPMNGDITITPNSGSQNDEFTVKISNLTPNSNVTVHAYHKRENLLHSSATFKSDALGVIDLSTDSPIKGDYVNVDPVGLIKSLSTIDDENSIHLQIKNQISIDRYLFTIYLGDEKHKLESFAINTLE